MIKSLNLEKLVKEKIDSVDIEKLAQDAIAKQMGGSASNPLTGLLGMLSGEPLVRQFFPRTSAATIRK